MAEKKQKTPEPQPKRVVTSTRGDQTKKDPGIQSAHKDPPGVKRDRDGLLYRPDDYMKEDLASASTKMTPDEPLTDNEIVAVEREIRRYVDIKGGFKANIPQESKDRCRALMKKIGRGDQKTPQWDRAVVVPGMERY
tara:strand:- start:1595 stop:2005 length:411 start_codon:yes stop_codon:yes gene_type:complete